MKRDIMDFSEETMELLGRQIARNETEAEIVEQAVNKSLKDLKILVDNLVNSVLAVNMRIDLQQAQLKLLSQRIDAMTELVPILKQWKAKQ